MSDATTSRTVPPELADADTGPAPVVQAELLTKRYGDVVAVDGLSFDLEPATITGFLGPNGAGKSTTLRMLLGLTAPTSGRALVFGQPYARLTEPSRRIGAALESSDFHPGRSGRDHLRMLADAVDIPRARVEEVLRLVELEGAARRRVGTYSLGMRQRLGLAAALLGDPELLILDEPANGLDPGGVRWLRDFLRDFAAAQRTVLISSHVLAEVAQTVRSGPDRQPRQARRRVVAHEAHQPRRGIDPRPHARAGAAGGGRSRHAGIRYDAINDHGLLVHGVSAGRVGDLAFAADVPVHELSADTSSLEEIFLGLTTELVA